jgi:hypothetical protein
VIVVRTAPAVRMPCNSADCSATGASSQSPALGAALLQRQALAASVLLSAGFAFAQPPATSQAPFRAEKPCAISAQKHLCVYRPKPKALVVRIAPPKGTLCIEVRTRVPGESVDLVSSVRVKHPISEYRLHAAEPGSYRFSIAYQYPDLLKGKRTNKCSVPFRRFGDTIYSIR